jgi:hypothetical protein
MNKHLLIYAIITIIVQVVIITDLLSKRGKLETIEAIIKQPELSNIDGLLNEIDTLQLKSDTIKLYYERKTSNYHILPRSERIRLFADRINR